MASAFFVSYVNLGVISTFSSPMSGFCAIRVSSMFSVDMSSGMLFIFSLGFRGLCMFVYTLSPNLSLMLFVKVSASWMLPVSIFALPSLSVLRDPIPNFISVGFIFCLSISLILSAVWLTLDVTVSFYRFCIIFPSTASEYSFPPPGGTTFFSGGHCVTRTEALDGSAM